MSVNRRKYDKEFKKNAVKLSYASSKTIKEFAEYLGVSESMLYRWRQVYTDQGEKARYATLEEENRALRLANAELRIEQNMLKKPQPTLPNCRNKASVHPGRQDYSVSKWACFLKVSQSGYYSWGLVHSGRDAAMYAYRKQIIDLFAERHAAYGPGRMCGLLWGYGYTASYRKVQRIMNDEKLVSIHCRSRSLTNSKKSRGEGFANLTKGVEIASPFQVLSSDISYIRTGEGFAYLCQVRDVASGVILSSSMSDRMKAGLVKNTIQKAVRRWAIPRDSIFHSDRGSQYTSGEVMELLRKQGLRQSFSRVGTPGDNAWSESFFANLKKEAVHWVHFTMREEARQAMFAYIDGFYNTKRIQKRLGYLSPVQWLHNWYAKQAESVA